MMNRERSQLAFILVDFPFSCFFVLYLFFLQARYYRERLCCCTPIHFLFRLL